MKRRPSQKLAFRVSLISDTHINEAEDFSASPYPANAEANPRARYVFDQIEQSDSKFCIHLGDMVNPVPELPSYTTAANNFHAIASRLSIPLYLMPGNHDIGDKPVTWMPAGMVNKEHVDLYRHHFGRDYFSFDYETCHFVIINSPLINSGDPIEKKQAAWLENDLNENKSKRIFLFSHYPVYVSNPDEPESYDNIDEPGRSWLINLIETYKPEALFAAHVHNFWYDVIGETEYYIVPSTCFVRHDYSEMYRIDGGSQQGRNDSAKLGHITLEIYEKGHVAHYHRSFAGCLAEDSAGAPPSVKRPHVKTVDIQNIYIDMRHAWAEELTVAPSGAVDEFRRKIARNDYPIMALWEMGIRGLRVPIQDLENDKTRRRMQIMTEVGHNFHVYVYDIPTGEQISLIKENAHLLSQLEIVISWDKIQDYTKVLEELSNQTELNIILSRVNRKDSAKTSGGKFNHLISHGFNLSEEEELSKFLLDNKGLISGVQFTITRAECPWNAAHLVSNFANKTGCNPYLYVKSTEASPAERFNDEISNTLRFGDVCLAAIGNDVNVIIDTFDDADRGYFTRTGLVDRRFNPRLASNILSELIQRLSTDGPWQVLQNDGTQKLINKRNKTIRVGFKESLKSGEKLINPFTGRTDQTNEAKVYIIEG
ncbi:MAG: metallophosphoesterase [Nisaea sp.]|nr:metallophosphoesterase [Nisaea sp.]